MARIKGGMNAKKKHNRTLKLAKGYRGARSKQYKCKTVCNRKAIHQHTQEESRKNVRCVSFGSLVSTQLQE